MTNITLLKKKIAAEKQRVARDKEYKDLSQEYFNLKNRDIIAKREARKQRFTKMASSAKAFLSNAGKNIERARKQQSKARQPKVQSAPDLIGSFGFGTSKAKSKRNEFSLM